MLNLLLLNIASSCEKVLKTFLIATIVPTKSDSHMIFCLHVPSILYNATHNILTCILHVRIYCSVVVMSTALDAGVPGSNLFRGSCFFSSYFY